MDHHVYCVYFCGRAVVVSSVYELSFWHISVNVNRNFLTWLEERNYCYEVREGAVVTEPCWEKTDENHAVSDA